MNVQYPSPYRTRQPRRHNAESFGDFRCLACQGFVSALPLLSGVQHRNHCPWCLCSRHLDLHQPGDRLSACKAVMLPLGLALKRTHKKYTPPAGGELMLIHRCAACGKLSLNRLAADDDPQRLLEVFEESQRLDEDTRQQLALSGIAILQVAEQKSVQERLFGINKSFSD